MYKLEGLSSVANFITAYEESQSNRDSRFLICSVFFVSKGNLIDIYNLCTYFCQKLTTAPHESAVGRE